MDPEFCEQVHERPEDELLLGESSWDKSEPSLKYAWRDKNGRRARGGELPISAIPQAVLFAARTDYLTPKQTAAIAKGLVDILANDGTAH